MLSIGRVRTAGVQLAVYARMYVYLIEAIGIELVKIGFSADPTARLADLSVGSPVELRLVGYFEGGCDAEKALHRKFIKLRERREWFCDDDAIRLEFESQPTWRAHRSCASEGFLKLPEKPPPAPPRDHYRGFQKTMLHVTTQRIIDRWLNTGAVRKDGVF